MTQQKSEAEKTRKPSIENSMLRGLSPGTKKIMVRPPPARKLFVIDEAEMNTFITGTVTSQLLMFLGSVLAGVKGILFMIMNIPITGELVGVIISIAGFVLLLTVIKKIIGRWKGELIDQQTATAINEM